MKKLLRVIRNGEPYTPDGNLTYYLACVEMQAEDGLYTVYQDDDGAECSVSVVKEEGSPFSI